MRRESTIARTTAFQFLRISDGWTLVRNLNLRVPDGLVYEHGLAKSIAPGIDRFFMQIWKVAGSTNPTRPMTMIGQQMARHNERKPRELVMPNARSSLM